MTGRRDTGRGTSEGYNKSYGWGSGYSVCYGIRNASLHQ